MAVDPLDVDLLAGAPLPAPRAPRGTRRAPRRPPSTSCATPRPSPPSRRSRSGTGASRTSSMPSSVRATCRITPVTPWPTSAAAQCTSAEPSGEDPHARGAVVVEALGVGDVLEADREADAAPHALAARRVAGAAGQAQRVARQLLRRRRLERGGRADRLGDRQRAGDLLAGREHVARLQRVQQPQLDRVDLERGRRACPSAPRRRTRSARRRSRASRRTAGCSSRRTSTRSARSASRTGPTANEAAFDVTAVELDAYAPPSSRIRMRTLTSLPVARRAVLAPDARRMAVHVPGERLLAVVDDLHRAVRVQREQRAVHLHRQVLAAAERAADAGEMDAHLLERRARGTARPARGRRAATASRRRCRRRPRRPAPRGPTPGRGTPDPGCRSRRRPRPRRRPARRGRRGGSPCGARRSAGRPRGSRGRASAAPGWRSGCSVARSMSATGSSGSYSTRIRSAARRACSGCSAATSATGSP